MPAISNGCGRNLSWMKNRKFHPMLFSDSDWYSGEGRLRLCFNQLRMNARVFWSLLIVSHPIHPTQPNQFRASVAGVA
jgi:hypothetical protein